MKIKDITFRNFKRFVDEKKISFLNSDNQINDLTLVVGNNGTGKSSILQAIVAMIAPLTHEKYDFFTIDWDGFEYRFIQSGGMPLRMKATIEFSEIELNETYSHAKNLNKLVEKSVVIPNKNREVFIEFDIDGQRVHVQGEIGNYYQFFGYQYAKQLNSFGIEMTNLFQNVGNIYCTQNIVLHTAQMTFTITSFLI